MYSISCIQRPLKGSNESGLLQQVVCKCRFYKVDLNLSQTIVLDSSKLKEFADDNFKFYENGGKLS